MTRKVVRRHKPRKPYVGSLREFHIPGGLQSPKAIRKELAEYRDVLEGREPPPLERGVITLMETANGYFSRACSIEQEILAAKAIGVLPKGMGYETLRTQEIRSFKEMAKSATELGSRRITAENLRFEQETRGLDAV